MSESVGVVEVEIEKKCVIDPFFNLQNKTTMYHNIYSNAYLYVLSVFDGRYVRNQIIFHHQQNREKNYVHNINNE